MTQFLLGGLLPHLNIRRPVDFRISTINRINYGISSTEVRPVIVWHGLGDSYNSDSMNRVFDIFREVHPDMYIYSVYLNEDNSKDQEMSLISNMNQQVKNVCDRLANNSEIGGHLKVDLVGFSQGGLFLRALVEQCGVLSGKVNNLITFGSPHFGISDLPECESGDWLCRQRNRLVKNQIWSKSVQERFVFAQYFRDVNDYDSYLEYSSWLVFLNNELEFNRTYKENLANIQGKFVMIKFEKDKVIVPKHSSWFSDVDPISQEEIHYNHTKLYLQDYIGLRKLDENNKLEFLSIEAEHMKITPEYLTAIASKYLGV